MASPDSSALPVTGGELLSLIRHWHRLRWAAVVALSVVVAVSIVSGAVAVGQANARLAASCAFYRDIAVAPVSVSPATHRPTQLGVAIILDARAAFYGQSCPGVLGAPAPALAHWAAVFGLPAPASR